MFYLLSDLSYYTQTIKQEALKLGFLDCGITRAVPLKKDAFQLQNWLDKDYHGEMKYMEDHFAVRTHPNQFLPGAQSVIIILQNYFTSENQEDPKAPVISKYAFGRDYHKVVRGKLKRLKLFIDAISTGIKSKIFVDSAPVMERSLARNAGLGWIGKNSLLLSRKYGSFFFIGGIMTNLELEPDSRKKDNCGDCTRCIDECPTGAIVSPGIIDSRKCISYLTIEYKGNAIPSLFKSFFKNRVFGCDICQDVCPWNKNAHPHDEYGLKANPELLSLTKTDWYEMDEERFNLLFKGSAVKRAKFSGLRRNLNFIR